MYYGSDNGPDQIEMTSVEQLVRADHLLRKVQKHIDFEFIRAKTAKFYCADNGRPALDPVILFKMLLLGYLFGIRSERRLVQEIEDNVAYRWFLGFSFRTKVPHHSIFSQNRRRRFTGTEVHQEIFDEIVRRGIDHGLVEGKVLFSDSTHIKANANKRKHMLEQVPASTKAYLDELDQAVEEDRAKMGKRRLAARKVVGEETREIKVSTTDPDSGYLMREGKPEMHAYLDHRTTDGLFNFITDVHVTSAAMNDAVPYLERLERQEQVFEFKVEEVALDAGYLTTNICRGLVKKKIFAVIGHRRFQSVKGLFPKWKFQFDEQENVYHCPGDQTLTYRTTNREGYREYRSNPEFCKTCPLLSQCTRNKDHVKTVTRHVWESSRELIRENRLSERGKLLYVRRKQTIERSFADGKELHGLRYARMRGLEKVREQCLLSAVAQNIKKLALVLDRRSNRAFCA